jgi:hypothetical protein
LQSTLINSLEKPIAKFGVDLESGADNFACGFFMQKLAFL